MKNKHKILSISLLLSIMLSLFLPFVASAEIVSYTDVLYDLQKDSRFDVSNYPYLTYDYYQSLKTDNDATNDVDLLSVIQVAESVDKKLFVYTYQPLEYVSEIRASSINMSVGFNSSEYKKYKKR